MKIESKCSLGDHFAGVKGGVCKLTLHEKDVGGSLDGNKNKIQNK